MKKENYDVRYLLLRALVEIYRGEALPEKRKGRKLTGEGQSSKQTLILF